MVVLWDPVGPHSPTFEEFIFSQLAVYYELCYGCVPTPRIKASIRDSSKEVPISTTSLLITDICAATFKQQTIIPEHF